MADGSMVMENDANKVIQSVKDACNPTVKADKLSFYLSDCLKIKKLSMYEAYLLQWEIINYTRMGYILPAWSGRVRISTCLAILNQKLLALIFDDMDCAKQSEEWGREALHLCSEKRTHYIMDRYMEFLNAGYNDAGLFRELLSVRENYASMSDSEGPYHVEVFPYHYFEPERILLGKERLNIEKTIGTDTENLLIALNIS